MRNALVHRQLEHLRIDQDQAHLARLGLVEQRQDHRVDRDRLAGAGRAGDQQVRHPREIDDHRPCRRCPCRARASARRACRCTSSTTGSRPACTICRFGFGSSSAHARLAGNRLDDADRHHRQRAREVLHQVDDLRALDADRRLDLVARDHRARIRREHPHLHAEVGELALDQARRELERLGADRLLRGGASSSSASGGSGESGMSVNSGRCFSFTTRSDFGDGAAGGTTTTGSRSSSSSRVRSTTLARARACACSPMRRSLALLARFARTHAIERLDARADALHHAQPRHAEEQREADREQREQQRASRR